MPVAGEITGRFGAPRKVEGAGTAPTWKGVFIRAAAGAGVRAVAAGQVVFADWLRGFGNLMVIDGCIMLTARDNFIYHEMMSHPALFTHPDPREVVIIGGGATTKEWADTIGADGWAATAYEAVTLSAKLVS